MKINRKGFTLIELMATIVIMGVLSTIGVVSVNKMIDSSKKKYCETQKDLVASAAQSYYNDHKGNLPVVVSETKTVQLKDLLNENYIGKVVDYNKHEYNVNDYFVRVQKVGKGKYTYTPNIDCENPGDYENPDDTSVDDFTITQKSISGPYYTNNTQVIEFNIKNNVDNKKVYGYKYELYSRKHIAAWQSDLYYTSDTIYIKNPQNSVDIALTINKKTCKDGIYNIKIIPVDEDGKLYKSHNIMDNSMNIKAVLIDTKKPTCEIVAYEPDNTKISSKTSIHYADVRLHAEGSDETLFDSIAFDDAEENKYLNNEGIYTYKATARDRAGNKKSCTRTMTIDNSNPICKFEITRKNRKTGKKEVLKQDDDNQYTNFFNNSEYTYTWKTYCETASGIACSPKKRMLKIDRTNCVEGAPVGSQAWQDCMGLGMNPQDNADYQDGTEIKPKISYRVRYEAANGKTALCFIQFVEDTTAPSCTVEDIGGTDVWYNHDVELIGNCCDEPGQTGACNETGDLISGCLSKTVSTIISETKEIGQVSPGIVRDNNGYSTVCAKNSKRIQIDKTPPTCRTVYNYDNNEHTQATVTHEMSDAGGSELKSNVDNPQIVTETGYYGNGYIYDNAGNSTYCEPVYIEISDPVITFTTEQPLNLNLSCSKCNEWTKDKYSIAITGTSGTKLERKIDDGEYITIKNNFSGNYTTKEWSNNQDSRVCYRITNASGKKLVKCTKVMIDHKAPEISNLKDKKYLACSNGHCSTVKSGCNLREIPAGYGTGADNCIPSANNASATSGKSIKIEYIDEHSGLASANFKWAGSSSNLRWPNKDVGYNPKYHMGYLHVSGNGTFQYTICDAIGNCLNGSQSY